MILEVAILNVIPGREAEFESAFAQASPIIASMDDYISHQLQHCLEAPHRYLLLVQWKTLEAHTIGFRGAPEYQEWKKLLHHFYEPFPTVEHYELVQDYSYKRRQDKSLRSQNHHVTLRERSLRPKSLCLNQLDSFRW